MADSEKSPHAEMARGGAATRRHPNPPHGDSEARLRLALEAAGMATWDWDIAQGMIYYSPRLVPMLGLGLGAIPLPYEEFLTIVHEDDRGQLQHAIEQALGGGSDYDYEFRAVWSDGSVHWIASRGTVLLTAAGEPERMIGVAVDITERKRAEQLRHHVLSHIVAAQEDERRRVSRELHDQTGQSLAALTVGLEALKSSFAGTPPALDRVRELQELANRLSQEVHSLAWELRPPPLDDLGLRMALRRYVEQWSERSRVAVDWHADGFTSGRLPSQVETTLYRVVQEALANVLKHAQATRGSVILRVLADSVMAIVEDDGKGFDVETAMRVPQHRLGLMGMRERVWLVNGTLDIESAAGHGTTIYVRIPLPHP
ncbi:MAG TPA: PAS domain-containing protein [Blastocatellia bacterium]|nr:PAS domain-containing protein [Blastocatellia bacterium]